MPAARHMVPLQPFSWCGAYCMSAPLKYYCFRGCRHMFATWLGDSQASSAAEYGHRLSIVPPGAEVSMPVQVTPPAKRPHARLEFAFVYPDRKGRNVMRTVGPCC